MIVWLLAWIVYRNVVINYTETEPNEKMVGKKTLIAKEI